MAKDTDKKTPDIETVQLDEAYGVRLMAYGPIPAYRVLSGRSLRYYGYSYDKAQEIFCDAINEKRERENT